MNLKIIENMQKQLLILEIVKLFRMVFFRGCLRMGNDGSYKNETFYSYTLPKEDLKKCKSSDTPLEPC